MKRKYWFLLTITPLFYGLDQLTKHMVEKSLRYSSKIVIVPDYFNLIYARNLDMAFGLKVNLGQPWKTLLFVTIALVALAIVSHLYYQASEKAIRLPIALSMILAGALGNLTDRFHWGYVVDFINWQWRGQSWPTFNIADTAITIGIILLVIDTIFMKEEQEEKVETDEQATTDRKLTEADESSEA